MQTIDLSRARVVVINDRGHQYKLTVSPIAKKQWLKYFEGIVSTSETQNGKRVDSFDSTGARLALVSDVLSNAEGYKVGGDRTITEVEGWKELVPAAHRIAVGNVLIAVERSQSPEDEAITLGLESVSLDAVWSWNGVDSMLKITGLRHIFRTPTVEQQRRYNRDMSRSQVMGGSRTGKTRWLGAQATLAELYDELITEVEGYTVNGEALGSDRDSIVASMDLYHKVAAAESLFTPAVATIEEPESE